MSQTVWLTTARIHTLFTQEIQAAGGHLNDVYHDGRLLIVRSLLPYVENVRPGDRLQGGVALRCVDQQVWVHPYVFRQVCRNGAIRAHTLDSRQVESLEHATSEEAEEAVTLAVRACCAPEVFAGSVREIRTSMDFQVDLLLDLIPMLSRFPREARERMFGDIFGRFSQEGD